MSQHSSDASTDITLAGLDRMRIEDAQKLPFATRDRLLDEILEAGRRILDPQIERQAGLFSECFEEDLMRLFKVRAVRMRFSGFIPIDDKGGVPTLDPRAQFRLAFENVKTKLEKAGTSLSRVVNLLIFLKNMDYWGEMNAVYRDYFGCQPTRAVIGTPSLNLTYQIEVANVIAFRVAAD